MKQTLLFLLALSLLTIWFISLQTESESLSTASDYQSSSQASKEDTSEDTPAYQPVLSQLQEEITLIKQNETPLLTDEDPESSYLIQVLEQLKGIAIDYTFIDLNKDGQKELLIGNRQKILAIYYLNQENQAVIALSAGRVSQQGERRSLAIYEDGTIVIKYFTGQETTVQADSYRITDQNLLPVKNITYRLSDTTEPATLLGLDQVASIDTSSLFWHSFD